MLKVAAIAAIVILPFLFNAEEASARRAGEISGTSGQCPVNQCGPRGLNRAKDVRTCSASNCRKSGRK